MTLKKTVSTTIEKVTVNGEEKSDKANHAVVTALRPGTTKGRVVTFKGLSKGFSTEVKLRRADE